MDSNFFSSPDSSIRDKLWSKELRKLWPEFSRVETSRENPMEKFTECSKMKGKFWRNNADNVYYFEYKSDATYFKLKYGV